MKKQNKHIIWKDKSELPKESGLYLTFDMSDIFSYNYFSKEVGEWAEEIPLRSWQFQSVKDDKEPVKNDFLSVLEKTMSALEQALSPQSEKPKSEDSPPKDVETQTSSPIANNNKVRKMSDADYAKFYQLVYQFMQFDKSVLDFGEFEKCCEKVKQEFMNTSEDVHSRSVTLYWSLPAGRGCSYVNMLEAVRRAEEVLAESYVPPHSSVSSSALGSEETIKKESANCCSCDLYTWHDDRKTLKQKPTTLGLLGKAPQVQSTAAIGECIAAILNDNETDDDALRANLLMGADALFLRQVCLYHRGAARMFIIAPMCQKYGLSVEM